MQFQDYYKTLEVERSATQDDIKKSYRRLSKKYHPDVNAENHDATEKFKKKERESKAEQLQALAKKLTDDAPSTAKLAGEWARVLREDWSSDH